jgi:hypothetical protein
MVQIAAAVTISPDRYDSIAPGNSIDYTFVVTNLGNLADIMDLTVQKTAQDSGWQYELLDEFGLPLPDRNHNGLPDVGPLVPFTGTARFRLRVAAPVSAHQGATDTVLVWAQSGANPLAKSSVTVRTKVLGLLTELIVAPDQTDRQTSGQTRGYNCYVLTQGNMRDVVNLKAENVNPDWTVQLCDQTGQSLLFDSNHDGIADVGEVETGVARQFVVKVTAPMPSSQSNELVGNVDSLSTDYIRIIGECAFDRNLRDTAYLTIQTIPELAIHNFENPFRDQTRFIFSIPRDGTVRLWIYDRAGELVKRVIDSQFYHFGIYTLPWDGKNDHNRKLAPGTYLYVFELTDDKENTDRVEKKVMIKGS